MSRHTSQNGGWSATSDHSMPWMYEKRMYRRGGRISRAVLATTSQPSTRTRATAQALSDPVSAVSKSMATNGALIREIRCHHGGTEHTQEGQTKISFRLSSVSSVPP